MISQNQTTAALLLIFSAMYHVVAEPGLFWMHTAIASRTGTAAFAIGANMIAIGAFWAVTIPLSVVDWWPSRWSAAIRMQRPIKLMSIDPIAPAVTARLFWQAVGQSLRNQAVGLAASFIIAAAGVHPAETRQSGVASIRSLAVILLLTDCMFYYAHRAMHTSRFYWIHKPHHQYMVPFAASAIAWSTW